MNPWLATLQWYIDLGVDEAIAATPWNRFEAAAAPTPAAEADKPRPQAAAMPLAKAPAPPPRPAAPPPSPVLLDLSDIHELETLRARLEAYDGCALKATATNTVFGSGPADARLMIIGEAPGEEEDRRGMPFVGPSGHLLDRMLAAIGMDREQVYIANTLYWRPPGNRTPTPAETQACLPFLKRQIELIGPKALLLVGAAAAKTMLQRSEGIMRMRGRWFDYDSGDGRPAIPALATFHPAYLLRSPAQKREAWRDLQMLQIRLAGGNAE